MADYYDRQITLMGINDNATKVTFNATLRPGYTRTMLADTIAHYCAFMVAVRDGVRQLDKQWGGLRPDYEYSGALMAHDYLINLWGGSKSGSMNYFTESTTAQDALDFYWQCKDDLAAIDLARVLEVANEGEREATLQLDTPYPVPTIVERTIAQQKKPVYRLGTEQADDEVLDQLLDVMGDYGEAFAREKQARQRHNPFVPTPNDAEMGFYQD